MTEDERAVLEAIRSSALQTASAVDALLQKAQATMALPSGCAAGQHVGPQTDITTMGGPIRRHCATCQQTYELQTPKED